KEKGINKIALAGGVAANSGLRTAMDIACQKNGFELYYPSIDLCTDNAAMIGAAAYYEFLSGRRKDMTLNAVPNLPLGQR
ncbi:MAG: tRNA (adenosine(37)-N6)-threonylcarbamoyltransferase complex transferase subunit TsaD, partial [Cellulosilyticaceae bacterium]